MDKDKFSPTEQRILEVLHDGLFHSRGELHACLPNGKGPVCNVHAHLTSIRKRLRPIGQDIICELVNRKIGYRHVRLLDRSE